MKLNKSAAIITSLFISFQTAPAQAITVNDYIQSTYQWMQKYPFISSIASLGVGLAWWWHTRSSTEKIDEKSEAETFPAKSTTTLHSQDKEEEWEDYRHLLQKEKPESASEVVTRYGPVTQLPVLKQRGNALCGYHALKNAWCFFEAYQKRQVGNQTVLLDQNRFNELFNYWHVYIDRFRKKTALANYLQEQFKSCLTNADGDLRTIYRSALANYAKGLAEHFIENPHGSLEIKAKQLREGIAEGLSSAQRNVNQHDDQKDREKYHNAVQEGNINAYLTIDDNFSLTIDDALVDEQVQSYYANQMDESKKHEWLDGDEIKYLVTQMAHQQQQSHFVVLDDVNTFTLTAEAIKKYWQYDPRAFFAFIVGTMSDKNKAGHWFTLIAQKNTNQRMPRTAINNPFKVENLQKMDVWKTHATKNDWKAGLYPTLPTLPQKPTRQYFVTDSLGTSRVNDSRVHTIIDTLNAPLSDDNNIDDIIDRLD